MVLHILCTVQWKLAVHLVGTVLHKAQQHLVLLCCDKQSFGLLQTAVAIKQYVYCTPSSPDMWQFTSWSEWLPPLPTVWPRTDVFFSGNSTQRDITIPPHFYCPALFASLYPTFWKATQHKTLCFRSKLTHWGRLGSFKLFKRPFPGFLTILTL